MGQRSVLVPLSHSERGIGYKADKNAVISRLNRIEGQIRGIRNMVEQDKCCVDVLIQVAAARSALNSLGP